MNGMTLSGLLRHAIAACLVLLPSLSQATDTHPTAAVKEAKPRITPFRPNPVPAATHTGQGTGDRGQGIIHGQPTGDELTPPWIALVWANGGCTGTFLNKEWVLTARHCVVDDNGNLYPSDLVSVTGGSKDVADLRERYKSVERIEELDAYTDVVLLKLNGDYPFPTGWTFKGVPLYHGGGYMPHKNVRVMGFGTVDGGVKAEALSYVDLRQYGLTAKDFFGAPALSTINNDDGGDSASGDSGGPVLLSLSEDQGKPNFSKLAATVSSELEGHGSANTLLTPEVLSWISEITEEPVINSPSDEQIFDSTMTKEIAVTWFGNKAPERVYLSEVNKPEQLPGNCPPQGNRCSLNITSLSQSDKDIDINIVRQDGSLDTVTVHLQPGGKKLAIVHPPKPESNQGKVFTYLPGQEQDQYTVSGYATAGNELSARLTLLSPPGNSNPNDRPCLDDKGMGVEAIKANEQGIWVCNIKVHSRADIDSYQFKIKSPGVTEGRVIDTVYFQVDARPDNKSLITMKFQNAAAYTRPGKNISFDISEPVAFNSTFNSEPLAYYYEGELKVYRPVNYKNSMKIKGGLYRNNLPRDDFWYMFVKPDATDEKTIKFVTSSFIKPLQTTLWSNASIITNDALKKYMVIEALHLNDNAPADHILTVNDDDACFTVKPDTNWGCYIENSLPAGNYTLEDLVNDDVYNPSNYYFPSAMTIMRVRKSPWFKIPIQVNNIGDTKPSDAIQNETLLGVMDRELYNDIKNLPGFNSEDAGVLEFCRITDGADDMDKCQPVPIDDGTSQTKVKIFDRLGGDKPVSWMTTKKITLSEPGQYAAIVDFSKRNGDAIKGWTKFTLRAPEVDVTNPPDGSVVNKDIATTPAGTGDAGSKIEATVSSSSTANAGQSRAALSDCTTIVDAQGHWQCEPVALEGDGVYTVSAREYDDSGKQTAKATSTFTVNREDVEKNDDGCQTGYAKGDDGDCHGPGKDAGHAKDGHGFGKSIGIGKFLKGMFDSKAFRCAAAMAATDGEAAKWCLGKNLKTGGLPGMPHRRSCPPGGNLYDKVTKSCRVAPKQNECPSGYFLEGGVCTGPAAGGPDFIISSPANGAVWDCGSTQAGLLTTACYVYGQVAPEDDVVVTLNDPGTGAKLLGLSDYHAVKYDSRHPELWRAGPVSLPKESTLDIQAQRLHNGRPVSGVDALQAIEISTPSDTPYSVLWPAMYEEAKGEAQGVIHGTAPTGTRVQVRSEPAAVSCDVVSTQDSWTCPSRVLTPGSYTLITHWTDKDGKDTGIPGDMRYFSVGPLPAVSITSPSDSDIVKNTYVITGTGYPGAKVSVTGMPSGDECTDRPVATDGKWACDAGYPVVGGEWSLKAQQTFTNGLSNTAEQSYRMADQHREVLTFTSPAQDAVLTTGTYKIAGTGYLDDVVTVTGMPAGSPACEKVSVDENGHWACPEDYPLVDGHYRLKAVSESNDDEYPEAPLTAWRDFSILTPPGAVADITEKKELGSCGFATHITYNCTTVLHLSDRAGKSVPGQSVTLSMSGLLHLKNSSPAVTDDKGDITVASAGSRDMEGQSPSGQLTATSGNVTRDFQVH